MAAEPLRRANETMWFIPKNDVIPNTIHAGQAVPGFVIQPGMGTHPVGQESGNHNNQAQQNSQVEALKTFLKVPTKTLGTIQIMIGLIHIGFGSVSASLYEISSYVPLASSVGYPFWGGLFFIGSGSLSVSAEKYLSCCWVKYTVGMNIASAVMACIGMLLYILEITINPDYSEYEYPEYYFRKLRRAFGIALAAGLFLFSFLEFCIATSTAHFGRKAVCNSNNQAMVIVPCVVSGYGAASDKANPAPSAYSNTALSH